MPYNPASQPPASAFPARARPLTAAGAGAGGASGVRGSQLRRGLPRIHRVQEHSRAQLGGGEVTDHPGRPQAGRQMQVEMCGGPVPVGRPLVYPQQVGSVTPEDPFQAGQAVHQDGAQPGAQPLARGGQVGDVAARGDQHLVWPRGRPWHACPPPRGAGDHQPVFGIVAEGAVAVRKLGLRDRGDLAERHDLAVRVVDGGADHPPAVLEHEHVADVLAHPERRGARRPQLDDPG